MATISAGLGMLKTDIAHTPTCLDSSRSSLYLVRTVEEAQEIPAGDDSEPLTNWGEWEFEQEITPLKLYCSGCHSWEYVALDSHDNVIELEPKACTRWGVHHITNWTKPCEYCGFQGDKAHD